MTCVLAIGGPTVLVAADSLAVDNESLFKEIRKDTKLFTTGPTNEYVIGFSGCYRAGQILRYMVTWPEYPSPDSDPETLEFFVKQIVPKIQNALAAHWQNRTDGDTVEIIIAVEDRFVVIPNDLQVAIVHDFAAIGSGSQIAIGAMEILCKSPLLYQTGGVEKIAIAALNAAQKHNSGVSEPFVFQMTKFNPSKYNYTLGEVRHEVDRPTDSE